MHTLNSPALLAQLVCAQSLAARHTLVAANMVSHGQYCLRSLLACATSFDRLVRLCDPPEAQARGARRICATGTGSLCRRQFRHCRWCRSLPYLCCSLMACFNLESSRKLAALLHRPDRGADEWVLGVAPQLVDGRLAADLPPIDVNGMEEALGACALERTLERHWIMQPTMDAQRAVKAFG